MHGIMSITLWAMVNLAMGAYEHDKRYMIFGYIIALCAIIINLIDMFEGGL